MAPAAPPAPGRVFPQLEFWQRQPAARTRLCHGGRQVDTGAVPAVVMVHVICILRSQLVSSISYKLQQLLFGHLITALDIGK
jgi:hypothetical protein